MSYIRDKNIIYVVLGMHRSGTSLCCQVLNMLGVDIASEEGADTGNEKGHYERWEIVQIHEEILKYYNRSYHSAFHDLPLPSGWWSDMKMRIFRDRLKDIIASQIRGQKIFGFKDPRTTKLMPIWNIIFSELQLTPRFIVCLRNPVHVAHSLCTRDGLNAVVAEMRALDYMVDAFRYTIDREMKVVLYEDWFGNKQNNMERITQLLGRDVSIDPIDAEFGVRAIIAPEMNRSSQTNIIDSQPIVDYFYRMAVNYANCPDVTSNVSAEIKSFVKHYTYFKQRTDPTEGLIDRLTAEKEAADAEKEKHRAHLSEAHSQINDLSERAQHLEAECESLRARIREILSPPTSIDVPEIPV